MKVIDRVQATRSLAEFAVQMGCEPLVVTSNGKPIAALLPIANADLETVSLSLNPVFLEIMEQSRARERAEGSISSDEMRRRLGVKKSKPKAAAPNFWIVGAAREGEDDHFQDFISSGYWRLFYRDEEQPRQAAKRDQMQPGDRIAIKKMVGGKNGKGRVRIRAIGTVERIDQRSKRVSVCWDQPVLDREVKGHSLFKSIHGPFAAEERVVREVFCEGSRNGR